MSVMVFPYAVLLLCFWTSPKVRRSLSSMKSFKFGLHYSCYIQYKVWRHRYTVLSVFLLTLFAINCMHVYYSRRIGIPCWLYSGSGTLLLNWYWRMAYLPLLDPSFECCKPLKHWCPTVMSARFNLGTAYFVREYLGFQNRYCRADSIGRLVNG